MPIFMHTLTASRAEALQVKAAPRSPSHDPLRYKPGPPWSCGGRPLAGHQPLCVSSSVHLGLLFGALLLGLSSGGLWALAALSVLALAVCGALLAVMVDHRPTRLEASVKEEGPRSGAPHPPSRRLLAEHRAELERLEGRVATIRERADGGDGAPLQLDDEPLSALLAEYRRLAEALARRKALLEDVGREALSERAERLRETIEGLDQAGLKKSYTRRAALNDRRLRRWDRLREELDRLTVELETVVDAVELLYLEVMAPAEETSAAKLHQTLDGLEARVQALEELRDLGHDAPR